MRHVKLFTYWVLTLDCCVVKIFIILIIVWASYISFNGLNDNCTLLSHDLLIGFVSKRKLNKYICLSKESPSSNDTKSCALLY